MAQVRKLHRPGAIAQLDALGAAPLTLPPASKTADPQSNGAFTGSQFHNVDRLLFDWPIWPVNWTTISA